MPTKRSKETEVEIDEHTLRLTNQDKVLWPDDGLTKGDLVAYYRAVAPFMLPHLRERALTLKLYPNGIGEPPIFLQAVPKGTPDWIVRWPHRLTSRDDGKVNWRIVAADEATLVWLANRAAIELHPWLSRTSSPNAPDALMLDLDPGPGVAFKHVCAAALDLRALLERANLEMWAKTSGGKGMHLVVPLAAGHTFDDVRAWAEHIATALHERWPERFTTLAAKTERRGRILIDYAQNSLGRTTAAVYSARGRAGGTVSAPLTWDEVKRGSDGKLSPSKFTITSMPKRLDKLGDLFAPVLSTQQHLPADFDATEALEAD